MIDIFQALTYSMVLYGLHLTPLTNEIIRNCVEMKEAVIRLCLGKYARKKHGRLRRTTGLLSLEKNIDQQMGRLITGTLQRGTGGCRNYTAVQDKRDLEW